VVAHMTIGFASLVLLTAASGAAEDVQLQDRLVRLSDLAVTAPGQANPVIARVPRTTSRIEFDEETARRMIRNRIPMAEVELAFEGTISLIAAPPASARRSGQCFVAKTRIVKGQFISASLTKSVPCEDVGKGADHTERALGPIAYDREARAPAASRDIAAGTYLGPVRPITDTRIAKDANVLLVTGAGPVTITRSVTTMQAGREGRNVVIRTFDGEVFTAPFSHLTEDITP